MARIAKGEALHLRLFLEGLEVPVISATTNAQLGGPAVAQIEIVPTDRALYLSPRTMVHLFYLDYDAAELAPEGTHPDNFYKLLFGGELFSVAYSKAGFGSRGLVLQCMDFSNAWDTSYLYLLRYVSDDGEETALVRNQKVFLGVGTQENPFDDIVSMPEQVIAQMAQTRSRAHHPAVSESGYMVGALLSILELVGGVHGAFYGINDWATLQERRIRLMEQIGSDDGRTALELYDQTVFGNFLLDRIGDAGTVISFRQLLGLICGYIFYDVLPQPTGFYRRGSRAKPKIETMPGAQGLDATFQERLNALVTALKGRGWGGTAVTSGFRSLAKRNEARALQNKGALAEPPDMAHDWGFGADLSLSDNPHSMYFIHELAVDEDARTDAKLPVYVNARILVRDGGVTSGDVLLSELEKLGPNLRATFARMMEFYRALGEEAKKLGLDWGGDFQKSDPVMSLFGLGSDPVHVQLKGWKQLRGAESKVKTTSGTETTLAAMTAELSALIAERDTLSFNVEKGEYDTTHLATVAQQKADELTAKIEALRSEIEIAEEEALQQKNYAQKKTGSASTSTSTGARERLITQIFRPDVWFVSPPICNVLFPEEYTSFSYNRDMMREVTRLQLETFNIITDDKWLNQHYFAPSFSQIESLQEGGVGSAAKPVVYPHERFTGIIPRMERMSDLAFYARAKQDGSNETVEEVGQQAKSDTEEALSNFIELYAQRTASFNLLRYRYQARTASVGGRFMPRLVAGFPGLVVSRPANEAEGTTALHFLGLVAAVSHSVNQSGGQTSVSMNYVRSHRAGDDTDDLFAKTIFRQGSDLTVQQKTKTYTSRVRLEDGVNTPEEMLNAVRLRSMLSLDDGAETIKDVKSYLGDTVWKGPNGFPITSFTVLDPTPRNPLKYTAVMLNGTTSAVESVFEFTEFQIVETDEASVGTLPLEEAIQPPWFSDDYKNVNIGGRIYRQLLGCGALVDRGSDIESAVDNVVSEYSRISGGGQYAPQYIHSVTRRPGATLPEVLGAEETRDASGRVVQKAVRGFHSDAVGDKRNLVGLDLAGVALQVQFNSETSYTVDPSLDPRAERYRRVREYRAQLLAQVGLRG